MKADAIIHLLLKKATGLEDLMLEGQFCWGLTLYVLKEQSGVKQFDIYRLDETMGTAFLKKRIGQGVVYLVAGMKTELLEKREEFEPIETEPESQVS